MNRLPFDKLKTLRIRKAPAGVILLEVVLALTLFVAMAATVGAAVNQCSAAAGRLRIRTRGADMAVTLFSKIQMGLIEPVETEPTQYENENLVDWTWEIQTEEVDMATTVQHVKIIVTHEPTGLSHSLGYLRDRGSP